MKTQIITITVKGKQYAGIKGDMSDAQFESMVVRNDMTAEKMNRILGGVKSC